MRSLCEVLHSHSWSSVRCNPTRLAAAAGSPRVTESRRLRQDFGYSRDLKQPLGCQAVYSTENPMFPWSDGRVCVEPEANTSLTLDCASGFGTAGFLTGTFGFAAASVVVQSLLGS